MARKTNKTSHILDLITNGSVTEPGSSQSADYPSGEKTGEQRVSTATRKVKVVDEASRNESLSKEILSNLTEELKEELQGAPEEESAAVDSPESKSEQQSQREEEGLQQEPDHVELQQQEPDHVELKQQEPNHVEPLQQEPDHIEPQQEPDHENLNQQDQHEDLAQESTLQQGTDSEEADHTAIPDFYFSQDLSEKDYVCVNVMEYLLFRQDVGAYLKEYDVCPCKRCLADIYALTLSNLPSKYVVVNRDSLTVLVGYYEKQFKIRLITQLIKACLTVRETPRHHASAPDM